VWAARRSTDQLGIQLDRTSLIPADAIVDAEVAAFAREASQFLLSHSWCRSIKSSHLAWAAAGVLGVFLCQIEPARSEVDERLWVVVGDLPAAYLVCDDAPTWREALARYIEEMRRWVAAVREGRSREDLMPVGASPTAEHADMLEARLNIIQSELIPGDAKAPLSDT
jgi:hypothetical protein